jgi:hypothetical protein
MEIADWLIPMTAADSLPVLVIGEVTDTTPEAPAAPLLPVSPLGP